MKKLVAILPSLAIITLAHPACAQEATQNSSNSVAQYHGTIEDGNREEADRISAMKKAWAQLTGNVGAMKNIVIKNYKDYERKNGIIPKDDQDQSQQPPKVSH